jgi:hypothetical protein
LIDQHVSGRLVDRTHRCSLTAGKKLGITDFVNPNGIGEQTVSEV